MIWSPDDYKKAAVLANEAAQELLLRLEWLTCKPQVIVDLGSGMGDAAAVLKARYPQAEVLAIDASFPMLEAARDAGMSGLPCLQADAGQLPFKSQSIDLVFANLLTPWCADLQVVLKECRRVLRPDGVILLSGLGPDTLKEWRQKLNTHIIPQCIDMHDVGDSLVHTGFSEPVLEVQYYTLTYRDLGKLEFELHATGMIDDVGLIVTENVADVNNNVADVNNNDEKQTLSVTCEVFFAHAFVPADKDELSASEEGVVRFPLAHLRRQLIK